ncbi:MAG: calcineurin-like phosphoesterase family protein [Balneolaceae bacterium]
MNSICTHFIHICLSLFIAVSLHAQSPGPEYAGGVVCEDGNRNGTCDPGEPGVAGVMVSNQQDVVLTGEDGSYRIPAEDESILFITKPAGYDLPGNTENLPIFYHIYQQEGSPELDYRGVEPSGPLPRPLNFTLIPSEKKESFTAFVFGDPQPRDHRELSFFRDDIVSELTGRDADMALVLGDIMFDDLSMYERYNRMMMTLEMPIYNIIGNHDVNFDADRAYPDDPNRFAKETYKRHYGPAYFSFEYGDVHFIALDNMNYLGRDDSGRYRYRGYIDEIQLEWIENNLRNVERDKLIVLLAHIGLYSMDSSAQSLNTVNREALIELLDEWDQVLFLGGHRHVTIHNFLGQEFGRNNPNPIHHIATTAASGSWWRGPLNKQGIPVATQMDGVPNGYHLFEFEGNSYRERYQAAGFSPDFQLRIESPASSLTVAEAEEREILVNFFNGTEDARVWVQINGESWSEMERLEAWPSPFYVSLYDNYEGPWSAPMQTNHIWRADLPQLQPGIYTIRVQAVDRYGQEFKESTIIEIE